MARISITTVKPEFSITTNRAQMTINSKRPRFTIKSPNATKMSVDKKAPVFKVNWAKVRSESGLPTPEYAMLDKKSQDNANTFETIGKISEDYTEIMSIEKYQGGNSAIAEISRQDLETVHQGTLEAVSMPQSAPEVEWDMGYINITWEPQNFGLEWDADYTPDISVTPYSVEIDMKQYGQVRISVDEAYMPKVAGRQTDVRM